MPRPPASLGLSAALILAWASMAPAGLFFHRHEHGERPHPTPEPGAPRHFCHTHERAGFPTDLGDHLQPTDAGDSYGAYIGGGGGHGSGPRCRQEGTFGWDTTGTHLPRRVFLGWNHGGRYQSSTGAYETDGPFEVPNIFGAGLPKIHHRDGE